jgi:hypothetical protein
MTDITGSMPVPNVGIFGESGDERDLHCGFMLRKVRDLPEINPFAKSLSVIKDRGISGGAFDPRECCPVST